MTAPELCLQVCEHFRKELISLTGFPEFAGIRTSTFPCSCQHPKKGRSRRENKRKGASPTILTALTIPVGLDYFKNANDTYGHAEGDRILVELTNHIRAKLRSTDVLGRFGGNELSRQAEQLIETVQTAQSDLDKKLQLQSEADKKHADDLATLDAARAQLAPSQGAVDKLAAAVYMGGRADGINAILTAASPQSFIDKLAIQRVMAQQDVRTDCRASARSSRRRRPSRRPRPSPRPTPRRPPMRPPPCEQTCRANSPSCRRRSLWSRRAMPCFPLPCRQRWALGRPSPRSG